MTLQRIPLRKVCIGLALLPLLAFSALLVLYLSVDLNAFRDDIAAEIEALTGRRAALAGDVQLTLSMNPTLVVKDVSFANAHWGSRPDMLRVGRMEGQVALLPLLSGQLVVKRILLVDTELLLETDALGRGNWALDAAASADGAGPAKLPVIDALDFTDLQLIWRAAASSEAARFALDSLTLQGIGTAGPLRIAARSGDGASPVMPVRSLRLQLEALGNGYRISDLDAVVGDSDLSGELEFAAGDGQQRLRGRLSSRRIRLADLTGAANADNAADKLTERAGKVFSAKPFGLQIPVSLNAELAYQVQQLAGPALVLENVSTQILADRGVLSVSNLEAQLHGARLTADLVLDTTGERPRVQLELAGRDVRFGKLLQAASGEQWLDSQGDLDVRLQGKGRSMAEIMAGLTGTTRLLIGQGKAELRGADALIGGFSTALGTLVDKRSEQARLNCIASSFEIKQGVASSRLLLADTEYSTVYGEGSIDLRSERLQLVLTPKSKSISLNVTVPVEVGGTLAAPSFTPEKLASARKGVGVLAMVGFIAFPPAALLGLGDLGTGEENPCLALAAAQLPGRAKAKQRKQPRDRSLIKRAADNVEGTMDGIGGAIKGLFN